MCMYVCTYMLTHMYVYIHIYIYGLRSLGKRAGALRSGGGCVAPRHQVFHCYLRTLDFPRWCMTLDRCLLSISCSRGTPPREVPRVRGPSMREPSPESITRVERGSTFALRRSTLDFCLGEQRSWWAAQRAKRATSFPFWPTRDWGSRSVRRHPHPLPSEKGKTWNVPRALTQAISQIWALTQAKFQIWLKPDPKSGLDCRMCVEFTRQQRGGSNLWGGRSSVTHLRAAV
jgi:hypothetical protein